MSQKSKNKDPWPKINSLVAVNAGTRLNCGHDQIAIVPHYEEEIIGVVIEHHRDLDSRYDTIDILVEDRIYHVMRTPSPHIDIPDYWNLREINDDETTRKF